MQRRTGVDLARVALRAAREQTRKNGGGQKSKPRPVRTCAGMGFGAAISALVTEHGWELPAAGATLRERWAVIAPGTGRARRGRRLRRGLRSADRVPGVGGVGDEDAPGADPRHGGCQ
ncbi:hypothetical protein GCM10010214_03030 [Streptomyces abikoensis]|nr:hypothetical protein GCM10010214_03030 [Streptomyces abikoensis]